jgi:hypothetical protein
MLREHRSVLCASHLSHHYGEFSVDNEVLLHAVTSTDFEGV